MSDPVERGAKGTPPARRYANYFQAGFNEFEFVIDFGEFYSDQHEPVLHTGIITNPEYARRLHDVLRDALRHYDEQFGTPPEA
jgi:hypothetical protein